MQKSIPSLHDFFRDILWSVIRYFCTWPGLFPSPVHDDPNVLTFAVQRLLIVTTLELLTSTYEISGGAMRGFGHSLTPALITVVGSCVLRLIWINTVCRAVHEFWVVMIIYPISWVLTGTVMITAYLLLRRKLMR